MIEYNENYKNTEKTDIESKPRIENFSSSFQNKLNQTKLVPKDLDRKTNVATFSKENIETHQNLTPAKFQEKVNKLENIQERKNFVCTNNDSPNNSNQKTVNILTGIDNDPNRNATQALKMDSISDANQKVIMVVDDSQTVRNIMALILNRAGYRSVRVASAMEALHTLTELIPDLIFLDVTLPGMDGLDICKIIKENPRTKQVPVVMLSGNGEVFDKVMGRLAGASDYITKPFEPESIINCIKSFCEQKNRLREGLWQKAH